uniref:hypothetical protein n=1 Tax=Alistipes senegalensis TaxID=1288121 RepID=UPI001E28B26F
GVLLEELEDDSPLTPDNKPRQEVRKGLPLLARRFAGTHNHHSGSYLFHDLLKRQLLPLKAERCQTLFILINQKKQ